MTFKVGDQVICVDGGKLEWGLEPDSVHTVIAVDKDTHHTFLSLDDIPGREFISTRFKKHTHPVLYNEPVGPHKPYNYDLAKDIFG